MWDELEGELEGVWDELEGELGGGGVSVGRVGG